MLHRVLESQRDADNLAQAVPDPVALNAAGNDNAGVPRALVSITTAAVPDACQVSRALRPGHSVAVPTGPPGLLPARWTDCPIS